MRRLEHATEIRSILAENGLARPCQCSLGRCPGWQSITEERWPASQMRAIGTLRDPDLYEATFEECHPAGTRYESPDAPLAIRHFPYNRCDLWHCGQCGQNLLRYTEFGGYYLDHRVRTISPDTEIID